MEILIVVAGVALVVWLTTQPRRDADAAAAWVRFHQTATEHGLRILYVNSVQQRARHGSKAWVCLYGDGTGVRRDAWFWWRDVQQGSVVAVRLSQGWGPHTKREGVLYIGTRESPAQAGVHATFGARELARAQRHFRRTALGPCSAGVA